MKLSETERQSVAISGLTRFNLKKNWERFNFKEQILTYPFLFEIEMNFQTLSYAKLIPSRKLFLKSV